MKPDNKCVHCGDDCGKYPIEWEDKKFCCNGCVSVYRILNQSKLYSYYEIENNPGIKIENPDFGSKYAYLDNEEIKQKLIDFSEGNISKVSFFVPVIHCSSCIYLLENLHRINPAIVLSSVNFVKKEVYITFKNSEISLRQVVELMASLHYIPKINFDKYEKKSSGTKDKSLLYKIGIAGFCFGNTMLLSFPEYLPGNQLLGDEFRGFFGILNFILALPVFFYSASDYLLSAFKNLIHKSLNIDLPISIGVIAIFAESSYQIFSQTGAGYMDSLTGLVFFLLIGKWYQTQTYQALSFERDYKSYFPVAISRIGTGGEESIPLERIETGDRLLIRNQELIPVDAILMKGEANIDYSFVTGESTPIRKNKGEAVFAGGKQFGASIEIEARSRVNQSRLTQLWNENESHSSTTRLKTIIDKVSQLFTIIILVLSLFAVVLWYFIDTSVILRAATSVLIVACPCALALSVPFAYGNTMRIFGRRKFYLRNTDVVENLHNTTTIVFDKTGTITENGKNDVEFVGKELTDNELKSIKSVVTQSTHPASVAIASYLLNIEKIDIQNFTEYPGQGLKANVSGNEIKLGAKRFAAKNVTEKAPATGTQVYVSINGNLMGYFNIKNKYRSGLKSVISELKKQYEIHIISGDTDGEKQNLTEIFGADTLIHFEQTPADKLNYIKQLRQQGKNVLMIGDGLNDAGALKQSNTGISIADNVYHFSPACDAILEARNFNLLPQFLRFSKSAIRVVRVSFVISFLYNVVGLYFAISGQLSPIVAAILMPASSVTVVAFVTAATTLIYRRFVMLHYFDISSN